MQHWANLQDSEAPPLWAGAGDGEGGRRQPPSPLLLRKGVWLFGGHTASLHTDHTP